MYIEPTFFLKLFSAICFAFVLYGYSQGQGGTKQANIIHAVVGFIIGWVVMIVGIAGAS